MLYTRQQNKAFPTRPSRGKGEVKIAHFFNPMHLSKGGEGRPLCLHHGKELAFVCACSFLPNPFNNKRRWRQKFFRVRALCSLREAEEKH